MRREQLWLPLEWLAAQMCEGACNRPSCGILNKEAVWPYFLGWVTINLLRTGKEWRDCFLGHFRNASTTASGASSRVSARAVATAYGTLS